MYLGDRLGLESEAKGVGVSVAGSRGSATPYRGNRYGGGGIGYCNPWQRDSIPCWCPEHASSAVSYLGEGESQSLG